jgi:hypothetical protein
VDVSSNTLLSLESIMWGAMSWKLRRLKYP